MGRIIPPGLLASLFFLLLVPPGLCREECTIGVASGRATADGRPLLWKNRDTGADSRNIVELRRGKRFSFLGLVNPGSSNVWAGVNEAGLALVNAQSADLGEKGVKGPGNGFFLAMALGTCADLGELRDLLEKTNRTGRSTHTSFGAIDARGGAGIFEVKGRSFVFFNARDRKEAPGGWIVRTNFAFTGDGKRGGGMARYSRARFLWGKLHRRGELGPEKVLRICARDLASPEGKPYPLPFSQPDDRLPPFSVETFSTIDRFTTRASVVFAGVKKGERPERTTMWCVVGEPVFSVAVPLWVAGGNPPSPLVGKRTSPLLRVERAMKKLLYVRLFRQGKMRSYLDTRPLPAILAGLYDAEDRIFEETRRFLRAGGPSRAGGKKTAAFQDRAARVALEAMRSVLGFWKERAPLRVGVFSGPGALPLCAAQALEALRIDPGVSAFPVDSRDILQGALDYMDVILFPGGGWATEACNLGEAGRKKVRDFVLAGGGGYVGICAGAYLGAWSSLYPGSLALAAAQGVGHTGRGRVEVSLTSEGGKVFPELKDVHPLLVYYANGPLLVPRKAEELEPFTPALRFVSDVYSSKSGKGKAPGKTFALFSRAGKGRVFLCAGHPEATRGLKWMVPRMARWAAGRPLAAYPEAVRKIPRAGRPVLFDFSLSKKQKGLFWKIMGGKTKDILSALVELEGFPGDKPSTWALGLLRSLDPKVRARAARFLGKREFLPGLPDLEAALAREKDKSCRSALGAALKSLAPFRPAPAGFPECWYHREVRILGSLSPGKTRIVRDERPGLYHHFTIQVPPGTERLVLNAHGISGGRNIFLFARRGGPAFRDAPGVFPAGGKLSPRRTLVVDSPAPGRWFAAVRADYNFTTTSEEWGRKRFFLPPAFRGVKYALTSYMHPLDYRPASKEGYYRDLFMDSGVALTSRRNLPAAEMLGLSMEYLALPNRGALDSDKALQVRLLGGWKDDPNGILLYPDGAPRFRCVYVNGGSATRHGASLGPAGRNAYRKFFMGGGSYTGSCAGAYLPTLAPRRQEIRKEYLHIWPGHVQPTGLLKTPTGLFIPEGSPLLRYADFGGDRYVAAVYHNGGCWADPKDPWFWAPGTEVLARFDYPALAMHKKAACWAWKSSPSSGRLVVIGSHPEGAGWGEQRDLMASILRYALEGTGLPRVKASLESGLPRTMDDNTRRGWERIGDRQYHHFTVQVPPGSRALVVDLRGRRPDRDLNLFVRRGKFAFEGAPGVEAAANGPDPVEEIRIESPEPGTWYIGVKEVTVVKYERTPWGWRYSGNLDVLKGVPYRITARVE